MGRKPLIPPLSPSGTYIYAIDENRIYEVFETTSDGWYKGRPVEVWQRCAIGYRSFRTSGADHFRVVSREVAEQLRGKRQIEIIGMLLGMPDIKNADQFISKLLDEKGSTG